MPLTQISSRAIEDTLRYVLGASGTNHYTFTGKGLTGAVNDPTLTLSRGHTYIFENRSGGHPFYIKTSIANGGTNDAYNTGVTNNGGGNGTEIVFTVPHDAPDTLYYQCSSHSSMAGQLNIAGSVADGSITESKLADDAVTADKLANSINSAIAANTAKDLTALSASNLTSGTVPDARFPATLPAASAANLTNVPAANITGTLPAISGANLTGISTTPADGSITQAKLNFPVANRNLIINGAMQVAQRGTSSTSNGYQTVDRWAAYSGDHDATVTSSQQSTSSSDTPYQNGFSNFFRFALNGAGTANANAYFELVQKIEAQDIATSGWNFKSSSSSITLSFWVRASTNQTFYGFLKSYDGTSYIYAFSFTASGNNTWTKITKTITGNSNLQFDNNNAQGLQILLTPFYGTDYTNDRTLNTWTTVSTSNYFPDMASTWLTAGASTFDITGVQLEVGSVATNFEHRLFADEFQRCQRYLFRLGNNSTIYDSLCMGVASNDIYCKTVIPYPVETRVSPTFTYNNITIDDDVASYNGSRIQSILSSQGGTNTGQIIFQCGSFTAAGRPFRVLANAAGGYIQGDCEL